ncbi:hypothetical protein [Limnoglobus roseus]|uniref:Uncharacterized protein n=1 Tax=Limnoglobus roseus TaxID=2598579 RepID=A0A5C1ALJ8_9BACT|nr:hypothetical protein [Limnoglobus roseus]QEL18846.1 hypothetical protein PX52LOC_05887 [Limnoglobus roseus]
MCRPKPAGAGVPPVDLLALWPWVEKIALRVAARYLLWGEAALDDLISAGYVRALEKIPHFRPDDPKAAADPNGAFRGWAYRDVMTYVQREAARLRGGGTFRSPRREPGRDPVIAKPISDFEGGRQGERDEPFRAEDVAEEFRDQLVTEPLPRTPEGDDCWWEGMLEPHHHLQKPFDLSEFHDE